MDNCYAHSISFGTPLTDFLHYLILNISVLFKFISAIVMKLKVWLVFYIVVVKTDLVIVYQTIIYNIQNVRMYIYNILNVTICIYT